MLSEPPKTKYDLNFPFLGIPVRVHPLFWIIMAILGYHKQLDAQLFIWIAVAFVSIMVHEYGHALSARYFGAQNIRVVLHGFGGLACSEGDRTWKQHIIELLWGPGAGFILAGLIFAPYWAYLNGYIAPGVPLHHLVETGIRYAIFANAIWGLLNLIPVMPLDGGQITHYILRHKRPYEGNALSFLISKIVAISVALIALAISLANHFYFKTEPYWFVVIMFGLLAYQNHLSAKHERQYGSQGGGQPEPRQAWEKDPDWWKKQK